MTEPVLDTTGSRPAVRLERYLPDPPPVVWQALTDRDQLRKWFPSDVIVDGGRWVAGAALTFPFPPEVIDLTLTGTVLAADEPRLLSYSWGEEEILRFELHPEGTGTRLILIDQLRPGWAARNAAGWEDCLDRLAGLPADPGAWPRRFAAYAAAFEPTIGPQEGPPADFKGDVNLLQGSGERVPCVRRNAERYPAAVSGVADHDRVPRVGYLDAVSRAAGVARRAPVASHVSTSDLCHEEL